MNEKLLDICLRIIDWHKRTGGFLTDKRIDLDVANEVIDAHNKLANLHSVAEEIRQTLHSSMSSAREENCPDGPWLPAGLCVKLNEALEGIVTANTRQDAEGRASK
jgi:hypothetical protein